MAIDFPNSPATNDDYTVGTTTWTYSGSKWVLKTYNSLHAVPVTAMVMWANTTYPTGWLRADGTAISRTTYSDLFTAISTTYGVGDGSTTFNLPNMSSSGTGSPVYIIKVTNSGALEPSAISHASNHTSGGSDVVTITGNQITGYQSPRNIIINGALSVDQRNSGASQTFTAAGALAYSVDSWYGFCTGANITGARVAGTAPFQYYYRFTGAASNATVGFGTRLEAADTYHLASQTCMLSAYLASSTLTTVTWTAYYASTTDTFGTLASPTRTSIATGTFTITSSVTRYSASISVPAAATTGIEVVFTTGALVAAATLTFAGVQLEAGSVATPFEFEPFETTLRKCQRYYFLLGSDSTDSGTLFHFGTGKMNGANSYEITINLPTTMRTKPVFSPTPTATNYMALNATNSSNPTCSTIVIDGGGGMSLRVSGTTSGGTASTAGFGTILVRANSNSTSTLGFSAEL